MFLPTQVLMGDTMKLIPTAMSYITMNPGYLGRSALPEGLKALFRPITVMVWVGKNPYKELVLFVLFVFCC